MDVRRHLNIAPMWRRVWSFLSVMFFLFLADGMLSYFVPSFLQNSLGSPLLMGVVMSTSSVAGLMLDLLFAKLLRATEVKRMMLISMLGCLMFVILLLLARGWPMVLWFVAAMVMWGLYYEFFGFANQSFVVAIAEPSKRTAVWSIMDTLRAVAYALAPLAMVVTMERLGEEWALIVVGGILFVGGLAFALAKLEHMGERVVGAEQLTVRAELGHWLALAKVVWPVILMGVALGTIDAIYWTSGAVVTAELARVHPAGGLFLPLYMISSILVGIVMGRWNIKSGKKREAQLLLLASGLVLAQMTLQTSVWWYLGVVAVSSFLSALSWPLLDAVYTDLLARMGRRSAHMVGLKNACNSLAYIVGPILGGWMVVTFGEIPSFGYVGWGLAGLALCLLLVTPRKLRLPQSEMRGWEESI